MSGNKSATASVKEKNLNKRKFKISKVFIYIILSFWALTTIYPFWWVITNSFKLKNKILTDSFALPFGDLFTLDNYKKAWRYSNIPEAYMNSIVISGVVTVVVIILAGFAAYGLCRYRFKGRAFLQTMVLAAMMFPVFATIIPVFRMEVLWGIANTYSRVLTWLSIILPQIAGNLSFAIIVLSGFIRSLPIDLEEAAFLEGYNVFQIFFRIIIPIAKPSFATVAIFTFLWSYNDLFTQNFFLRYKWSYSIVRLLQEINSQRGTDYGLMAAAVVIIVVPILIIYVLLQKNIIKGLTAGAIKG